MCCDPCRFGCINLLCSKYSTSWLNYLKVEVAVVDELCKGWRGKRKALVRPERVECCATHKWESKWSWTWPAVELSTRDCVARILEVRGGPTKNFTGGNLRCVLSVIEGRNSYRPAQP